MKPVMWICWISLITIPHQTEPPTIPTVRPEIGALIKSLNNKEPAVRLAAAEQLAKVCDPGIVLSWFSVIWKNRLVELAR